MEKESRFDEIKFQAIEYIYDSIFREFVYKNRENMEPFYEQIREMAGESGDFFVSWAKGFVSLADFDFAEAEKRYNSAFKNISGAADYLPHFLQQAFALFMYSKKIDEALEFWSYGVSKGIFAAPTEKFLASFNEKEQFWVQFSPKMFRNLQQAEKMAISDYQKKSQDGIQSAVDSCDFEKFKKIAGKTDFDALKIDGASVLYYAIQKKGVLNGGVKKFTENLVQARTDQLLKEIDLSALPENFRRQQYMNILHQIRLTFEKSGLAAIIFTAQNGNSDNHEEFAGRLKNIDRIIEMAADRTSDVDAFEKHINGKVGTNALFLAAELDDFPTIRLLIEKGSDVCKKIGYADFGMKYADGSSASTEIPNSFIYRLVNFKSWNSLKNYLELYAEKSRKTMKEKSEKCNVTPLVYFILNTVYPSGSRDEFEKNRKLCDDFLPLFISAGSSLEQKTAFGSAKKLLGIK